MSTEGSPWAGAVSSAAPPREATSSRSATPRALSRAASDWQDLASAETKKGASQTAQESPSGAAVAQWAMRGRHLPVCEGAKDSEQRTQCELIGHISQLGSEQGKHERDWSAHLVQPELLGAALSVDGEAVEALQELE